MRAVKKDRQMTRAKSRDMYAPNVSLSTIDQYLRQNKYRKWLAKERPKLEDKHVFQRQQWELEQYKTTTRVLTKQKRRIKSTTTTAMGKQTAGFNF
jgi:hypothetical protein